MSVGAMSEPSSTSVEYLVSCGSSVLRPGAICFAFSVPSARNTNAITVNSSRRWSVWFVAAYSSTEGPSDGVITTARPIVAGGFMPSTTIAGRSAAAAMVTVASADMKVIMSGA
jgi:hypothetical protein